MKVVTNILNKHLGAVHNSSPLTIVQRKAMNLLLKNAEKEIHEHKEHKISIQEVMKGLGWSAKSKSPDTLKECLSDLVSIKIQWNVLEADRQSKWVASALLASVSMKDGDIYYSYSNPLRELLSRPNIYAKLDLGIQKSFKVKYSMLIWEYISGELSSKKSDHITTQWIPYKKMLKLTYLEDSIYEKRYSFFLNRVIDKSITELNNKSDVNIEYETIFARGKLTHIRFIANRKGAPKKIDTYKPETDEITQKLLQLDIPSRQISSIKNTYSKDEIKKAYDFFLKEVSSTGSKIKNPIAFFKKALEEGWVTSEQMDQHINEAETQDMKAKQEVLEQEIENLKEIHELKLVRLYLLNQLGYVLYKNWFHAAQFQLNSGLLQLMFSTDFHRDWAQNNYRQDVEMAVRQNFKNNSMSIDFVCTKELMGEGA